MNAKRAKQLADKIFKVIDCISVHSLEDRFVVKLHAYSITDVAKLKSKLIKAGFTQEESDTVEFKF